MARYNIRIKRSAAKEIEALPAKDRKRVVAKIQGLADSPRPVGSEKLSGEEKYRLRQGDLRIPYVIVDDELIVTVVKVANRRACTDKPRVPNDPDVEASLALAAHAASKFRNALRELAK